MRHESTYIISFLTRQNKSINDDDLHTSAPYLARSVYVLLMMFFDITQAWNRCICISSRFANINEVVRNVDKSYGERWVRAFIKDGSVAPQHGPTVVFRCLSRNNHNFTTAGFAKGGRRKFTFQFPEGLCKRGSLRVDPKAHISFWELLRNCFHKYC